MKLEKVIVDADLCIKIGTSPKYLYLEKLMLALAKKVFIHKTVYNEIITPRCAKEQIDRLIRSGVMELLDENRLSPIERTIYNATFESLAEVMINPRKPNKNRGEVSSIAIAKTLSIPFFATDEKELQPIIDNKLNNGIDNIQCIRIKDIIIKMSNGEIEGFSRKEAKVLWRISGKSTDEFDTKLWKI